MAVRPRALARDFPLADALCRWGSPVLDDSAVDHELASPA